MSAQTFNGYANHATWNVALYIGNDEKMYRLVLGLVNSKVTQWTDVAGVLITLFGDKTPDGVAWNDPTIDVRKMNEFLAEMID